MRKSRKWIRFLSAALAAMMIPVCGIAEETEKETDMKDTAWYHQALQDSVMRVGNNYRLKRIIGHAMTGEHVTIGTIGGSITEGAGAASYGECWAAALRDRFAEVYGSGDGDNVYLVNAGVGGTPSTFGYMRYQREIAERIPETDEDGLADIVVIEFSVNDWQEPTGHRCFESMVKEILRAPNKPAVILLFSVFRNGFNLQEELKGIGEAYDLMMVSVKDGFYGHIGQELTEEDFFFDEYHPKSLGHGIMADCIMTAIARAETTKTDKPMDTKSVPAVYGTDFLGLKTIFGDTDADEYLVERGGFRSVDINSYHNKPVGWVCGKNFFHDIADPADPLRITGIFHKCLIAWKASAEADFGTAEVWIDGEKIMTLAGGEGKWGQSEVVLALDDTHAKEHVLEIRMAEERKKFTITAIGLV